MPGCQCRIQREGHNEHQVFKGRTDVPSVLNNHTNSQMLSHCNAAATQILNISHSKGRETKIKPKTEHCYGHRRVFILAGVVFPEGRLDVAVTWGHESDRDQMLAQMTNTSWGQVQSGLSWQELLLLSKDRSRRTGLLPSPWKFWSSVQEH